MKEEKKKLSETLNSLNKTYGKNSVIEIKNREEIKINTVSTGSYSLDWILGNGGFPLARIIEIVGMESSGKSCLSLHVIKKFQQAGYKAAFIDAEHSFSSEFAKGIGVNVDDLIFCQPDDGNMALAIVEKLVETGDVKIIVVDSVAALTPKKELDGELEKIDIALQARMMSKFLRRVTANVAKKNVCLIMLNQLRDMIGMFFGNPNISPGGKALKFYSSIRLKVVKGNKIKDKKDEVIGNQMKIEAIKNKTSFPFRKCCIDIIYTKGIDTVGDILDVAVGKGIIERSGSNYTYKDEKLAMGRDHVKKFLEENPEIFNKVKEDVYAN